MRDEWNRYRNEYGDAASVLIGIMIGTAFGVGLGILFAPKAGRVLRRDVSRRGSHLANTATEHFQRVKDSASDWADRGREMSQEAFDAARTVVADGIKHTLSR